MDPHSFFADPDPAVFLNADPDPAAFKCGSGSTFKKFVKSILISYNEFPFVKKTF